MPRRARPTLLEVRPKIVRRSYLLRQGGRHLTTFNSFCAAVVSSDHADPPLREDPVRSSVEQRWWQAGALPHIGRGSRAHSGGSSGEFWCVVDGFVVDATDFVDNHPGGMRKLLSTNRADAGADGRPFSFSFSRGRNAHFPDTGKRYREGVKRYLSGGTPGEATLPPADVVFSSYGKITILGRLSEGR